MWWFSFFFACAPVSPNLPLVSAPSIEQGQRVELAQISFSRWTDYIPLMGAVDARCEWLDPAITDESTGWPPIQGFWVIYDDPDDVELDAITDTYFVGDEVSPQDFAPREGLEPLGFLYVAGFQRSLLDVEEVRRPDPSTIEAVFGHPIDATLRFQAEAVESGCTTHTTYCEGDCSEPFAPLEGVHFELGGLFSVRSVEFR